MLHGQLTDHRVIFLGDSTLRYLYLSIINLAAQRTENVASSWGLCTNYCFWNERTWSSWTEYYRGTSLGALLQAVQLNHS